MIQLNIGCNSRNYDLYLVLLENVNCSKINKLDSKQLRQTFIALLYNWEAMEVGENSESPLSISIVDKDIQETGLKIEVTFSHFVEEAVYFIISFETPAGTILVDPKLHYSYGVIHDMDYFIDSISAWIEWLKKDSKIFYIDGYEQYLKYQSEKVSVGSYEQLFSIEMIKSHSDKERLFFTMSVYAAKILSGTSRNGCFSAAFIVDREALEDLVEFFKGIKRLYELYKIESLECNFEYQGFLNPLSQDHLLPGEVMTMAKNSESPLTKTDYSSSIILVDKDIQETGLKIEVIFSHFIVEAVYLIFSFETPAGTILVDPRMHYSYGVIYDMDNCIDSISAWLKNESEKSAIGSDEQRLEHNPGKVSVGSFEFLFYMEIKRFPNNDELFLFSMFIDTAKIATDMTHDGHFGVTLVVDRNSLEELLDFFREIKRLHKLYKIASPELFLSVTDEDDM